MTADTIRNTPVGDSQTGTAVQQNIFLREIAAQLAELNETLVAAHAPVVESDPSQVLPE